MPKWDYMVHSFGDATPTEIQTSLVALGQDAWELVTVTPETDKEFAIAYLKRPQGAR